jgi:hypothetical protein
VSREDRQKKKAAKTAQKDKEWKHLKRRTQSGDDAERARHEGGHVPPGQTVGKVKPRW